MELEELKYKLMSSQLAFSNIKLNIKQTEAYNLMVKGENVFITGCGGTGKSETIKLFMTVYKNERVIGCTSTTGISALIFGGSTLHSYLGLGIGTGSVDSMSMGILRNSKLRKKWNDLEILVIDEVSMLDPILFDKIEQVARSVRRNEKPFGGVQLILSGDFLQLPPVKSDDFCFDAKSWAKCVTHTVYLTEIIRQSDKTFQDCLNNVRLGNITKSVKKILNSRVGVEITNEYGIKPTKLYSTNASVDYINQEELDKLAGDGVEFYEYEMDHTFSSGVKNRKYILEKYIKSSIVPETLQLCKGAQVMLLFNLDIASGLANGSRGIVTNFDNDLPIVKFNNGKEMIIDYHDWDIEDDGKKQMRIVQIPLKLAWVITIHKSQSMSLDIAEIELSRCFEYGQAYVALSRIKTLDGLSIINDIDFDKLIAHPKSLEYYENLSAIKDNTVDTHIIADIHINNDYAIRSESGNGNLSVVQYLVEKGADIHARDDEAIRRASENGHLSVVQYLFSKGANIHAQYDYALRYASRGGYLPIVQYLAEKGADVHALDDQAIRHANTGGHLHIVRYLVEKGCKPTA